MSTLAVIALIAALAVGFAGVGGSDARTAQPQKVGTFLLVQGRIVVEHAGRRARLRVTNGMALKRGDVVIMQSRGASARVQFSPAAKQGSGVLFSIVGLGALVHQLSPGVARLGPRVAFSYDGRAISLVAGEGVDAPVQISRPKPAGAGKFRISFGARGTVKPTFACSVDGAGYRPCTSPQLLRRGQTLRVYTTSLFGFHGPAATLARVK